MAALPPVLFTGALDEIINTEEKKTKNMRNNILYSLWLTGIFIIVTSSLLMGSNASEVVAFQCAESRAGSVSHSDSSAAGDNTNQPRNAQKEGRRRPRRQSSWIFFLLCVSHFPAVLSLCLSSPVKWKPNSFDFPDRFNYIHLEGSIRRRFSKDVFQRYLQ